MDQRSLQLGLLNAFLQIKAGDGLLPTPISEIAASPSMHAELTGPRFVRGTATVTMGASKSFKTIDHVRQGLAQALGRPIGTARAGTREPFLHLLYEDPVHKISNIGAAILRGLNENLALPNNYYMKHMRGVPLADALLSLRSLKAHACPRVRRCGGRHPRPSEGGEWGCSYEHEPILRCLESLVGRDCVLNLGPHPSES